MSVYLERLKNSFKQIDERISMKPVIGLVLGSGLGDLADEITDREVINYSEIEGFPSSTVKGHKGRFVFGKLGGAAVVAMQGRVHFYEGYSMEEVVMPIRLLGLLGVSCVILTNASGGINPEFNVGDFMLIEDQISTFIPSPLRGENYEELGPRFPDMTEVYDKKLRKLICEAASKENIPLRKGTYVQLRGPQFESPAEIKMLAKLGADAAGMSTVCEALAARHMGINIAGISCVTNMAAGISKTRLSHEEVFETANRVSGDFRRLIKASVKEISAVL